MNNLNELNKILADLSDMIAEEEILKSNDSYYRTLLDSKQSIESMMNLCYK